MVEQTRNEGRCVNCGFLGKRVVEAGTRAITPSYYEIDREERANGQIYSCVQEPLIGRVRTEPFCFVDAADITREVRSRVSSDPESAAVEVFEEEQKCKAWYPYNPGLNPKDHFDQMNVERMEYDRRGWEIRLEAERKEFDLKLFKASQELQETNRQIAEESYKTARRSFRFTLFSTIIIVFLTLITLFLTLLQVWLAMRQRGNPLPFQEWLNELGSKLSGG